MMHFAKAASILGFQGFFPAQDNVELREKFAAHVEAESLSFGTREEFEFRFEIFQQKDAYIKEVNDSQDSYELGHNMFSTMTEEEAKRWLGAIPETMDIETAVFDESVTAGSIDWRSNGGVNAVKNQGRCGSCWAFGATAGTEHAHWRASKKLLNLSEQQLVDCDTRSHGCNGGWHTSAWAYLQKQPQMTQSQYPYTGKDGNCKTGKGVVSVQNWAAVGRGSVLQHKAALNQGVVSIALAAGNNIFMQYKGGILDNASCPKQIDHAVAMVGYGTQNGKDYWIIRNSWGARWGEQGYMRLAAHEGDGICGSQNASYIVTTN